MRAARVWFLPPTHLQARTPPPPPPPTPAPFRLLPLLFLSLFFKQPLDFLGVGRTCPTIAGTFRVCLPLVCRSHAEPVSSAGRCCHGARSAVVSPFRQEMVAAGPCYVLDVQQVTHPRDSPRGTRRLWAQGGEMAVPGGSTRRRGSSFSLRGAPWRSTLVRRAFCTVRRERNPVSVHMSLTVKCHL